jgi:hypothetical protein
MPTQLSFDLMRVYQDKPDGITVPVVLTQPTGASQPSSLGTRRKCHFQSNDEAAGYMLCGSETA